jgi:folate-binding protein YgfZ
MFSQDGYQALRHGCGIVRRGDRGVLGVSGADRLTWLQGLLTNDVAALAPGGVCEAAYLTPQGRMITDMRVVALDDRALLDVPAPLAASLRAKLDTLLFAEDAAIDDLSGTVHLVEAHGPSAPAVVAAIDAPDAARPIALVRHDAYEIPGYAIFVAAADVDATLAALGAAGGVETTLETLDVVRIEAGRPAFLVDMDEHTIPLEAGIEERAISFTKGCYVGQEVIVRVMHRGQGRVAKKLVGLRLSTSDVPAAGSPIVAGGREIGRITSAAFSPSLSSGIALGYVHRDFVLPATPLRVTTSSGEIDAAVVTLPFIGHPVPGDAARA